MLRICTIQSSEAAKTYYTDPHAVDYYTAGLEKPGVWGGLGAERLGLKGAVDKEDFHKLCDNKNPASGEHWTSRNKKNRRVGYDFNFHAPKSVSVLHALTGDDAICVTFERSVFETMRQIEKDMATRVRIGGEDVDRTTGNLVWSQFTHLATRPVGDQNGKQEKVMPDPHMHVHAVAFNGTWDPVENRWKAGQFGEIKFDARYYEACFFSRLVQGLQDLGYEIERTAKGWEIAEVGNWIRHQFSQRTHEIEKAKKGKDLTVKQEALLGQDTRRKKSDAEKMTSLELKAEWRDRIGKNACDHLREIYFRARNRRAAASPRLAEQAVEQAADFAIKHVNERKSVDTERGVIAEAVKAGLGKARHDAIESAVRSRDLLRYNDAGRIWCTTEEVLAEERSFIDFCKEGRFAHEAQQIAMMLDETDGRTLVLLNETFSSTAGPDAVELLAELTGVLAERGARTVLATHLHQVLDRVSAGSLTILPDKAFVLQRARPDGRSLAREVAREAGLDFDRYRP